MMGICRLSQICLFISFNRYTWQKTEWPPNLFSTKNWLGILMKWQCVDNMSHYRPFQWEKKIPIRFTTFILALNIWFYLKSVSKCPVSALMLKNFLGLHLARFACLSRDFSGGTEFIRVEHFLKSCTPEKLIGLRHFWESLYLVDKNMSQAACVIVWCVLHSPRGDEIAQAVCVVYQEW